MAHFAELDINNKVIRVLKACNQDIANNGGELSEQAAQHFSTVVPLSKNGIKYIQTSYNNNFRKQYAGIGYTYDSNRDEFVGIQPFPSWYLDSNNDWKSPINFPTITTYSIVWDETNLRWLGKDEQNNTFIWSPETLSWITL